MESEQLLWVFLCRRWAKGEKTGDMCNSVNKNKVKKYGNRTSGQDRGIGRYILPPHTTKRRTTNLKTKNSQNCQKIQLYGSPTTKELKKKHSSILVGAAETAARTERACGKAEARRPGWARRQLEDHVVSHSNADKPGGTTGERDTAQPRVPSQ